MALVELHLELDSREEGRRRPEHDLVAARLEVTGELSDATLSVRLARGDDRPLPCELDAHARRGLADRGVENVCRDRDGHVANLRAWTR